MKLADELLIEGFLLIKAIVAPLCKLTWKLILWIKDLIAESIGKRTKTES